MEESRLDITHSMSNIPCHPKIRILIDGTRDETRNILGGAKDEWEG